jgi:glycosidase
VRWEHAYPLAFELLSVFQELGVDTLLLGPVMQSSGHGYDVSNYFEVDRRLGSNEDLREFSQALHGRGMRLVLDAVFHHTGRDFWAFDDVLRNEQASLYRDWYHLDFSRRSPYGDNFYYEGWAGHYDLVKLSLPSDRVAHRRTGFGLSSGCG